MYRFQIVIALLLSATALAGCSKIEPQNKPIRIALSTWPGYAHAFIAREKGFFKQNGVDVELFFKREYFDALSLYRSGAVDGILEVFTDAIYHNSEGVPSKVVCVTDWSDSGDVIVARPDIGSALDLKEKPVGIEGINTFSHMFVLSALTKAGLKEEDLRFEIVAAQEVPKALDERRIVAGHTWEPAKSEALGKGYKILAKAGDIPGIITGVLAMRSDVTEKRGKEIRGIVQALFQARDFVQYNRIEAVAIMAKAEGMTPEEMDRGLNGLTQPGREQNKLAMEKRHDEDSRSDSLCLFTIGRTIYAFYGKRGRYFSETDLDEIVDPEFLE